MKHAALPDFSDAERWVVQSALRERYGDPPPLEAGEAELRLDAGSETLTTCPTLFWQAQNAAFALFKLGPRRFRGMFYYSVHDQYDTGGREYDEIADCASVLLKLQEDHARVRSDLKPDAEPTQIGEAFANRIIDF